MHAPLLSLLALLLTTTTTISASPLPTQTLSTHKPWHLTNLTLFTASSSSLTPSYITFTFTDPTAGRELTTTCTRHLSPAANPNTPSTNSTTTTTTTTSSNTNIPTPSPQSLVVVGGGPANKDPLADASTWYPCGQGHVAFQYAGVGQKIQVQRRYRDPAVGEAPWDIVTAFGTSTKNVEGRVSKGVDGVVRTVKRMEVVVVNVVA